MEYFSKYRKITQNGKHFKTEFELHNVPLYLANSLRRSFSSNIPTVTFSDTYYDNPLERSINIKQNTSALHNEFLSQRISFIPINMQYFDKDDNMHSLFDLISYLDENGKRQFLFKDSKEIPIFTLKVKNNSLQEKNRDKNGLIEVTTLDFNLPQNSEYNNIDYFPLDVFTNNPIVIDKLKYNITDPDEGDELDIICTPTVGQGKQNARYDPTGTVTFNYKIDENRIEEVLQKKIKYLSNERKTKGLEPFTESELDQIKTSFNLLDKNRVFEKDEFGNPNIFEFSIETIGFLNPDQIIFDGMAVLYLQIKDVINSVDLSVLTDTSSHINEEGTVFNNNSKISISDIDNSDNLGINVNIKDENHTIGNLVSQSIRNNYCGRNSQINDWLAIASYKMQHPTIEEIDFTIAPYQNMTENQFIENIYELINVDELYIDKTNLSDKLLKTDRNFVRKLFCTVLFVNSLYNVLYQIKNVIDNFSKTSGIKQTSFTITDDSEYYEKNLFCAIHPINKSTKPVFR